LESKKHSFKIKIKNADPWAAGWITHYLYKMVDKNEIRDMQITRIKKSEKSIELVIVGALTLLVGYFAGKGLDIPYNSAMGKILRLLARWKKKRRNMSLDVFLDEESIE